MKKGTKKNKVRVAVIMGSKSDADQLKPCGRILREFGVGFEVRVLSAHRTPEDAVKYVKSAASRGIEVVIAAAGAAAHLAGVCAAHTDLPVIGVPMESGALRGFDSLLSTVQMPPGVPVACVAIGSMGAKNAAYLALRIMALKDAALRDALAGFKASTREDILKTGVEL